MSALLLAVASVLLAGVGEELAFRGVLLRLLLPRGVGPAVLLSSVLFGLMHVANLAVGADWPTTLLQVTFTALAGAGYAAVRLRTGSLWPCIGLHALFDLTFRVGNLEAGSPFQQLVFLLHGIGWAVYACAVLRGAAPREC
jgi:membrane protease YdiL (CAAX protease family)